MALDLGHKVLHWAHEWGVRCLLCLHEALPGASRGTAGIIRGLHYQVACRVCQNMLGNVQVSKEAVALQLNESWWREYQVLPGRTHPGMMTSGTGGYVLSGTKAAP